MTNSELQVLQEEFVCLFFFLKSAHSPNTVVSHCSSSKRQKKLYMPPKNCSQRRRNCMTDLQLCGSSHLAEKLRTFGRHGKIGKHGKIRIGIGKQSYSSNSAENTEIHFKSSQGSRATAFSVNIFLKNHLQYSVRCGIKTRVH